MTGPGPYAKRIGLQRPTERPLTRSRAGVGLDRFGTDKRYKRGCVGFGGPICGVSASGFEPLGELHKARYSFSWRH